MTILPVTFSSGADRMSLICYGAAPNMEDASPARPETCCAFSLPLNGLAVMRPDRLTRYQLICASADIPAERCFVRQTLQFFLLEEQVMLEIAEAGFKVNLVRL